MINLLSSIFHCYANTRAFSLHLYSIWNEQCINGNDVIIVLYDGLQIFCDDRDDYYTTIEKMLSCSQTDKLYTIYTIGTDYMHRQITKICFEPSAAGRDERTAKKKLFYNKMLDKWYSV